MNYYLQDSNSDNWQLGVTTSGALTTTSVGAESIPTLILEDTSGNYWQLGVTTAGALTTTSTGAAAVTTINLTDSSGNYWNVQVTTAGALTTTFLSGLLYPGDMTPGCNIVYEVC